MEAPVAWWRSFSIHGIGENLGGVTPWSPWSPRPFEEKAFFAGNGQDIRRELWKTLHYCWKSSRKQFGNDLKPSLKSVLEENLQIWRSDDLFLSLMRLVFVKLKVRVRQLKENNIQEISSDAIGENFKWSRCQFTFSISFHARPQTRNFQRPTQEHGTKIRGGAVKVITFLQSVCQS